MSQQLGPLSGAELIFAERHRQIHAEGWTPEHDDEHTGDQLASAAACYAMPKHERNGQIFQTKLWEHIWPWGQDWWKPTPHNRIKELVKAGALIAAEIDRLQRIDAK